MREGEWEGEKKMLITFLHLLSCHFQKKGTYICISVEKRMKSSLLVIGFWKQIVVKKITYNGPGIELDAEIKRSKEKENEVGHSREAWSPGWSQKSLLITRGTCFKLATSYIDAELPSGQSEERYKSPKRISCYTEVGSFWQPKAQQNVLERESPWNHVPDNTLREAIPWQVSEACFLWRSGHVTFPMMPLGQQQLLKRPEGKRSQSRGAWWDRQGRNIPWQSTPGSAHVTPTPLLQPEKLCHGETPGRHLQFKSLKKGVQNPFVMIPQEMVTF